MADTTNYVHVALAPHYWGKGKDTKEALRNCRAAGGRHANDLIKQHGYMVWRVHPEFQVDDFGDLYTPAGHPAILVKDARTKKTPLKQGQEVIHG